MAFKVIETNTYEKGVEKWDKSNREAADKMPIQLRENPYSGDQVTYPFLREKRIENRRIYYLIYEDLKLVLLVATSTKKNQQKTINHIKDRFPKYRILAEDIAKQLS